MFSVCVMKRGFDLLLALLCLVLLAPVALLLALAVRISSPGAVLHWSDRVGRNNQIFRMPKFRSMRSDTPALPTHMLVDAQNWMTPIGPFLRRTSLDELPQLWSILKGDMSFVGPRPALFNQEDLVALRTHRGIHHLMPGLTGWAQVNGRDELTIAEKVEFDADYLVKRSFLLDLKILWLTLVRVVSQDAVSH